MDREPLMIDARGDDLVEMAACALALAHAHDRDFGAAGRGVTTMFARCATRLRALAEANETAFEVIHDLAGDTDESVLEASKRLREVYEREIERNPAHPWCRVLEGLLSVIDEEVARRPDDHDLPVM
jgi:hypothetical protein